MNQRDTWASAEAYEAYVGRWSRLVAKEFLNGLAVLPDGDWLDLGCGTAALTETILEQATPARVIGIDSAQSFVVYARRHVQNRCASFTVGDAMALPFADETFGGAVVSGLVLNFIPRPQPALAEMMRVAGHGCCVAAYLWDYAGQMQMTRMFWDAAVALDPAVAEKDQGRRFPICQPEPLAELFESAGLAGVDVRAIDVTTRFRDFDDYWLPFLAGQGPAPSYVAALNEESRTVLRERIRSRLPLGPDGSISLIARAWAVRGRK